MGFLKDLRTLSKQGRQIADTLPSPAQRMGEAQAQMARFTEQMTARVETEQAIAADGVAGTATVTAAAQTGALVNYNPVVRLDLLVTLPGQPPYPLSVETSVPQIHLARVQPGGTVPVSVARANREQLLIDWDRPL